MIHEACGASRICNFKSCTYWFYHQLLYKYQFIGLKQFEKLRKNSPNPSSRLLTKIHIFRVPDTVEENYFVGGQHEALRPWQRSWGRRLDIRKGGIEPQESPWKSSSIYPHNQSLPILLLCALTYTSDFMRAGGLSPTTSFGEGVNLELQLVIIPGHDRSVSTYKLLRRFSSLPDRLVQPHVLAHSLPTVRGTRCFKPSKSRFFREVRKPLV